MRHAVIASGIFALAPGPLLGCAADPVPTLASEYLRYVALGDSYTIGTSVGENDRWPNRLVASQEPDVRLELVANLAVNGATSADVLDRQLPHVPGLQPEFATLLVGVNDVVRGVSPERYAANLEAILDHLLELLPHNRLLMVSTPDYTRTPRGADFGEPTRQRTAIARANEVARTAADARGIAFVDISDIADRAGEERTLVAIDGLHPSGRQYELWVERMLPVVVGLLSE
jgi:lysophospholipase L1-like esterase